MLGLFSTIIESLTSSFKDSDTNILGYWYFDNRNSVTLDVRKSLRSILRQISAPADPFPAAVRDVAKEYKLPNSNLTVQHLVKALKDTITQIHEDVFILIDAIDECPLEGTSATREDLLDALKQLVECQLPNLHLLITGIRETDIIASLRNLSTPATEVDLDTRILEDVDTYLNLNLEKLGEKRKWVRDETKVKIKESLEAREQKYVPDKLDHNMYGC